MSIKPSLSFKRTIFITIALVGIQFLSFGATITSRTGARTWNVATDWVGNVAPTVGDDVIIVSGATVSLTASPGVSFNTLTINGTGALVFSGNRTLTMTGALTLDGTSSIQGNSTTQIVNAGSFSVLSTATNTIIQNVRLNISGTTQIDGALTFNTGNTAIKSFASVTISNTGTWTNTANNVPVSISGDLIVSGSGVFNQGTGRVTFTGASSNLVACSSTIGFGGGITVNKGLSTANIIDIQGPITMLAGGLTLTNGTFKLSNVSSTIVPFTTDPGFGATARLWCNGGTMNSTVSINWTFSGTLQVSAGTVNVGIALDDYIFANNGTAGTINVSGGAINVTGRIRGGADWNYSMSGGVVTVGTVGNTAGFHVFNLSTAPSTFSMTSGTIIIVQPDGVLGYQNIATGGTFTGGTLQIGNASTPAASTIGINTTVPIYNLTVNSANATAQVQTQAITVSNNVTNYFLG
jgi:hypothetical protein